MSASPGLASTIDRIAVNERALPATRCGRCGCRAKSVGCSCSCHALWCDCHGERHALCAQLSAVASDD